MRDDERTPPESEGTDTDGFEVLRTRWGKPEDAEAQAEWLAEHFDEVRERTKTPDRAARGKDFRIRVRGRGRLDCERMHRASRERFLECKLLTAYGAGPSGQPRVEGLWRRLAGYQVPLYDHGKKDRWGHVDLLGLGADGSPVTIELKVEDSTCGPFEALLEVLANVVAVKSVWPAIAAEVAELSRESGRATPVAPRTETFPVQLLAPVGYWSSWGPEGKHGRRVAASARAAVARLRLLAGRKGFPVHFEALTREPDGSFTFRRVGDDW